MTALELPDQASGRRFRVRPLFSRLLRNGSLPAMLETLVGAALILLTFRVIVRTTSFETFGIWALLQSLATTVRMVDIGIGGSLIRYVGQLDHRARPDLTWKYIDTGLLFNAAFFIVAAVVAYLPLRMVIAASLPGVQSATATAVLPLVLVNLVLTSVAQVPLAGLVGIRFSTAKSVATISGALCLLLFTFMLVSRLGLAGLIWAQILQQIAILCVGWTTLSFALNGRRSLRLRLSFDAAVIRQTASVSIWMQANGMLGSLLDVAIKFALTRWGGASATGMFELANRFVSIVRSLLIVPTNLAIPPFARALKRGRQRALARLYSRQMRLLILASLVFYGLAFLGSPVLSLVVLNRIEPTFFLYFAAQWIGSFINILASPSAALGVAGGSLRGTLAGTTIMVAGSAIFGNLLGYWYGAWGTLGAAAVSISFGSITMMILNCRRYGLQPVPSFRRGPGGTASLRTVLSPLIR